MQFKRILSVAVLAALMLMTLSAVIGPAEVAASDVVYQSGDVIGPNLLSNPGMEGDYQQQCSLKSDPPWVPAPTPCDPSNYDVANRDLWATAQVPVGWAAWWRVPNNNYQDPNYYNTFPHACQEVNNAPPDCRPYHNPEFRDTRGGPQERTPSRKVAGDNSQKYFTFYSVHEAGLYQIVPNVKPGDRLRFSVYMMAWSSAYNDPYKSDSQATMGMQVGIDPTGGNNPWSPNIVWAPVQESYDKFSLFTVEAVAKGTMVSVWTKSAPYWAIQHNDVYVDEASLNVVQAAKPTPRPRTTRIITSTEVTTRTVGSQIITSTRIVTKTVVVTPVPAKPITGTVTSTKPISGTQPIPASGTYTVVRGDTLIAIARRFGITPWWKLGEINGLQAPYVIDVGQVLKLK